MTTAAIRKRLISYLTNAEEKEIKAIYTLVEDKIRQEDSASFSDEQMSIVNERRAEYLSGKDKGISWEKAHANILNSSIKN